MEKVNEIRDFLGLSVDHSIAVLRHFKWDVEKL
jgi:hypothetical protein